MNTRECLKNVTYLLEGLEGTRELTRQEKINLGYNNDTWSNRKYYWDYKVRDMIAMGSCDRDRISKTMLSDMKKFLELAMKLGFYGKVEFKTGYNGRMLASTRDTDVKEGQILLRRSFESKDNFYSLLNDKGERIVPYVNYTERAIKDTYNKYMKGEIG